MTEPQFTAADARAAMARLREQYRHRNEPQASCCRYCGRETEDKAAPSMDGASRARLQRLLALADQDWARNINLG